MRIPPPLLVALAIACGLVLQRIWPFPVAIGGAIGLLVGTVLVAGGLGLVLLAGAMLVRSGQDPKPWKPTPVLITAGPYSWSRNPIYLGMLAIGVGIGGLAGNGWIVVSVLASALLLKRLVIDREEWYLDDKFGDAYREYKANVRRWL